MTEAKCILSSFCCGISLRSASMGIAIASIVWGAIDSIIGIFKGVQGQGQGWGYLICSIIIVIASCILLQGIKKDKRAYVMSWVWVISILIFIYIILAVVSLITLNFANGVINLIVIGLAIYCVLVVRSYAFTVSTIF
ncbi:uncharacterized protein [Panulirus ornatus]